MPLVRTSYDDLFVIVRDEQETKLVIITQDNEVQLPLHRHDIYDFIRALECRCDEIKKLRGES